MKHILAAAAQIPVSPKIDRVEGLSHADGFGGANTAFLRHTGLTADG
jgi:hypothetical protein